MASIVLASAGAYVGNAILPGIGGRLLGAAGKQAGQRLDEEWGWADGAEGGRRLTHFKIQDSSYGTAIPVLFGCARVAGNVIWVSDLIETEHQKSVGGKGGALGASSVSYTYSLNCAVALAAGETGPVQTIWADSKIIYQNGVWTPGVVNGATFYAGAADQEPDPLLESWIGAGLTPAYRGTAYVVLEGLQLAPFGNRLPNLTFEILPPDAGLTPQWLGADDPDIFHVILSNRNQGMPPLTVEGGSRAARRVIVGGYNLDGATARLTIIEYDVTGDAPTELTRTQSDAFAVSDIGAHGWALAPDGRFVACGVQDGATGKPYYVALYDTQTRTFGPLISVSMALAEARQVAWLDAQRFAVMGYQGGRRGVQIFMRSGLSVLSLGFWDVWGAGTQTSRVPEMFAQFIPFAGGLLHFVVNAAPGFSLMEARHLSWQNNGLVVGPLFNLLSGVSTGSGTTGQAYLLRSGEQEWTFFYGTTLDMHLFSFVPGRTGATITRPWQVLQNASFGAARCHAPVLIGGTLLVVQRSSDENFYRLSRIALNEADFSLETDGELVADFPAAGLHFGAVAIAPTKLLLSVNWGTQGDLGRLDIMRTRRAGETLDKIVGRILERAGYEPGDYDVSALADVGIDGYALGEQTTGISALEPLRLVAPFDLIDRGGVLQAVLRGQGGEVALEESELGASAAGGAEPEPLLAEARAKETSLPIEIEVDYEDSSRDYETGSQKARRAVSNGSRNVAKLSLPVVMTPSRAKQIAEDRLFGFWSERTSYRFFVSRAWLGIEPGDCVTLGDRRMRVTEARLADGVMRLDAVACPASMPASGALAEDGKGGNGANEVASVLYLMDLPLLRAEDDAPGFYAAVSGLAGWPGASLWRASDGVNFARLASFSEAAVSGSAGSALPARLVSYRDRTSVLQIQLLRGELASCTEADLLNGANAALVGTEIVQFKNATLLGPGLYALSELLRGRSGTESSVGAHVAGENFVLLTGGAVQFIPAQISDRNASGHYRAVSNGALLDFAQDLTFSTGLRTLEPLAPAHLRAKKQSSGDIALSWVRRARKNGAWVDYIDVPLDEEAELYDLEIVNTGTGAVLRTVTDVAGNAWLYAAAQQTEDWGGAASAFTLRVYQKSARFGRGQKAETAINV